VVMGTGPVLVRVATTFTWATLTPSLSHHITKVTHTHASEPGALVAHTMHCRVLTPETLTVDAAKRAAGMHTAAIPHALVRNRLGHLGVQPLADLAAAGADLHGTV
jgi:hypothetical protein